MATNLIIYTHQKPLILTDDEEQYFTPPAEFYHSYVYCKVKTEEDVKRIIGICEKDEKLQMALLYHPLFNDLKKMFEDVHTTINAAGGLVLNEKNEILLIERNEKWDLPKGKADANETAEQTAIREVKEETGILHLEILKPICSTLHTYKNDDEQILKTTNWFLMQTSSSENLVPQTEEGITNIIWVSANDLNKYTSTTYLSIKEVLGMYLKL
jgi:8-oxo-dGTP pyrophosphatase MutT (NUDIX family)